MASGVLRYVKLTENALPPTRESSGTAGLDLRGAYDVSIPASGNGLIKTSSDTTASRMLW